MTPAEIEKLDIFLLEDALWLATAQVGLGVYDFAFQRFFACRRPYERPPQVMSVGRFGVTEDYAGVYRELAARGVLLIHTPEQYLLASELTHWYPRLEDLTPRSAWFDAPPPAAEIESRFDYPVFLKGSRQTSRHRAALSIARSRGEYEHAAEQYRSNPILHWQPFVCREFIELRRVAGKATDKVPPSFEFRTFWWRGEFVGAGPYWAEFAAYNWTREEKAAGLKVAQEAARRINVPFLVVDIAQTIDGTWIVSNKRKIK
jgi:hypothetical protein